MSDKLFRPLTLGAATLSHRVALAPLTRFQSDDNNIPIIPLAKEYYEQRASIPVTLIIPEGTYVAYISQKTGGYANIPGIWNNDQVQAWKVVTDAVHAKRSFIFVKLWAVGRAAKADVLKKTGHKVVSSSAIAIGPD